MNRGVFGIKSKIKIFDNSLRGYDKCILQAIDTKQKILLNMLENTSEQELELTKFLLISKLQLELQKGFERIEKIAKHHIYLVKPERKIGNYYETERIPEVITDIEKIKEIKIDEVLRVMKRVLSSGISVFHLGKENIKLPANLPLI